VALQGPSEVQPVLHRVNGLMRDLLSRRMVSSHTFGLLAAIYIQARGVCFFAFYLQGFKV
jgi:hypothetical protein